MDTPRQYEGLTKSPASEGAELIVELSALCMRFAEVRRIPRYEDGRKENDAEHSYMLAMIATSLAERYRPQLDHGKIALYALIHDIVEVEVGDTPTFGISDEELAKKADIEAEAIKILLKKLPPPWRDFLEAYEKQQESEARFVRLVDKALPSAVTYHFHASAIFSEDYKITQKSELDKRWHRQKEHLLNQYPEFADIIEIIDTLTEMRNHRATSSET